MMPDSTDFSRAPDGVHPQGFWPDRFAGQVILVSGSAGGLGGAACDRIESEGGTVVRADIREAAGTIALNVTDRSSWQSVVDEVVATHGRLDGALLAHGIQGPEKPVTEIATSDWLRTLEVNLTGTFHGLAVLLSSMIPAGYGRIGVLSSISAQEGNVHQAAYSASKAGVTVLVKTAAKEAAARNVTVNAIAPSMFQTPLVQGLSPERNAALLARVPMGRIGQPPEFAALAAWLLSSEASYTTGQTFDLSGGRNTA